MSKKSIKGLILAGGQSSRMGRDKALIKIQGIPLLKRVYDVAQDCVEQIYIVTPRKEEYREILPPECQFIEEQISPEIPFPHGPLVGFSQGLAQIKTDWVLLLAGDLPYLNSSQLQQWIEDLNKISKEIDACLPRHPKGWEPLCGLYRHCCLSSLQDFIHKGGRSFQAWLSTCSVQELPVEDSRMLFNCNTPQQLLTVNEHFAIGN